MCAGAIRGKPACRVVDAAMTNGAAMLMSMMYGFYAAGHWQDERGVNLLAGGAPFYRIYRCAGNRWIAVGCIEPQFYAAFMKGIGAEKLLELRQREKAHWPHVQAHIARTIATRTRDEWAELFAGSGSDACVTPVLSLGEGSEASKAPLSPASPPPAGSPRA